MQANNMSNETQKSAVDFAFEKLANQGLLVTRDYKNLVAYREAKEMEKEQHSITWENTKSAMEVHKWESFQQYFNKTYGGTK
jgi:hypothetical protein